MLSLANFVLSLPDSSPISPLEISKKFLVASSIVSGAFSDLGSMSFSLHFFNKSASMELVIFSTKAAPDSAC